MSDIDISGKCLVCGTATDNRFCSECYNENNRGIYNLFEPFHFKPIGWQYRVLADIIKNEPDQVLIKARRSACKSVFADLYALLCMVYRGDFVLFSSVSDENSCEHISMLRQLVHKSKIINELSGTADNKHEIKLTNGARALGIAQSEKTKVGYHPDLKIIDEASRMKDSFYFANLAPMGAAKGSREIILSTPYGGSSFFGTFYHDPPDGMRIYSIELSECWWITKERLEYEYEIAPSRAIYQQESLGEFVSGINRVFSESDVRAAIVDNIASQRKLLTMGVDFGRKADHTAVVVYDHSTHEIVNIQFEIANPTGTWKDRIALIERIYNEYDIEHVYADATGLGDPIIETLAGDLSAKLKTSPERVLKHTITGVVFTRKKKQELYNRLQVLFKSQMIKFKHHDELENELAAFVFLDESMEKLGSYTSVIHDDILDALALAVSDDELLNVGFAVGGNQWRGGGWSRVLR